MGGSSEVDNSIWILSLVFDSRVGVVCCTFIRYLCCPGKHTCIEAATLCRAATDSKDVQCIQNIENSSFKIVMRNMQNNIHLSTREDSGESIENIICEE